jgi:hypothetical protein
MAHFSRDTLYTVGFEVLTVVIMKSSIFWDVTVCSRVKVNRRFRGTYRLYFQGRMGAKQELCLLQTGFLLGLFFYTEDGGDVFP